MSPHLHRISSVSNLNYKNLHDGNLVRLPYMAHLTDVLDTHLIHTLVLVKVIAKPTRQHLNSWPYLFKRNALFHSPLPQFCTSPSPPVMTYSSHLPPWKFPYGITTLSVHTLNFLNYSIAVSLSANVNPYIICSPVAVSLLEQIINSHMHASYLLFHWASNKPIGLLPLLSPSQPATIVPPPAATLH